MCQARSVTNSQNTAEYSLNLKETWKPNPPSNDRHREGPVPRRQCENGYFAVGKSGGFSRPSYTDVSIARCTHVLAKAIDFAAGLLLAPSQISWIYEYRARSKAGRQSESIER